jgi:hypothetical protein
MDASPGLTSPTPDPLLDKHADPELERLLPQSVAGTDLRILSLTAAEFLTPETSAGVAHFVQEVGGDLDKVTLATGFDPARVLTGAISAVRVPGADPATLQSAYVRLEVSQADPPPTISQRDIGGKLVDVMKVGTGGVMRYVFSTAAVLFIVDALDEPTATAFIKAVR